MSTTGITNALTLRDVHAMLRAVASERDRLLLWLLWTTGGRVTEVLSIRVADVLDDGAIRLLNEKQRNPDRRLKVCFVPSDVITMIDDYVATYGLRPNDYLFAGRRPGSHLSRQMAWLIVKRMATAAGVIRIGKNGVPTAAWTHLLRHGTAVNMVRQRVPLPAIKDQLGHASLQSTDVYARMFDEDR